MFSWLAWPRNLSSYLDLTLGGEHAGKTFLSRKCRIFKTTSANNSFGCFSTSHFRSGKTNIPLMPPALQTPLDLQVCYEDSMSDSGVGTAKERVPDATPRQLYLALRLCTRTDKKRGLYPRRQETGIPD